MKAFVAAVLAAFFNGFQEEVKMTVLEKAKELGQKLGIRVENWSEEKLLELAAAKDELDAETRRKTRLFWGPAGFIVGALVGYLAAVML